MTGREERVDIGAEPIDPDLKACILNELATQPGSRVIKRKGQLFFRTGRGFEVLCQRLCEVKAQWLALVEYADLTDEEKMADLQHAHAR